MSKCAHRAVDRGTHYLEGQMTMSSSTHRGHPFFLVQAGIVAWEEPAPVSDWTSKTITVCAPQLPLLASVLWTLALAHVSEALRVFRWHVAPVAPVMGQLQRRRLVLSMQKDPPGFAGTTVALQSGVVCMASELAQSDAVDLQYLSAYRTTALLATPGDIASAAALCRVLCGSTMELSGQSIAALRARSPAWRVLRVLELESYSALQLIGSVRDADSADHVLATQGVRRVLDVKSVPAEIARWND
jgi:hypothetical protein